MILVLALFSAPAFSDEPLAPAIRKANAGDISGFVAEASKVGQKHAALARRVEAFEDRLFKALIAEGTALKLDLEDGSEVRGTVTAFENGELHIDLRGGGKRRIAAAEVPWDSLLVQARSRLKWKSGDDYIDYAAVLLALGDPKEARKMRASASRQDVDLTVLDAVWKDFARAAATVRFEGRIAAAGPDALVSVFEEAKDDDRFEEIFSDFVERYRTQLEAAYAARFDPVPFVEPELEGKVEAGARPGTVKVTYDFSKVEQLEDWRIEEPGKLLDPWDRTFEEQKIFHRFQRDGEAIVAGRLSYIRHVLPLVGPASLSWRSYCDEYDDTTLERYVNVTAGSLYDDGKQRTMYSFSDGQVAIVREGFWMKLTGKRLGQHTGRWYRYKVDWDGEVLSGWRDGEKVCELKTKVLPAAGCVSFFAYLDMALKIDDVVIEGRPDPKQFQEQFSAWVKEQLEELRR
ncbi:MAG: hypothetical protein RL885_02345 [Planctomycetota bacterium]